MADSCCWITYWKYRLYIPLGRLYLLFSAFLGCLSLSTYGWILLKFNTSILICVLISLFPLLFRKLYWWNNMDIISLSFVGEAFSQETSCYSGSCKIFNQSTTFTPELYVQFVVDESDRDRCHIISFSMNFVRLFLSNGIHLFQEIFHLRGMRAIDFCEYKDKYVECTQESCLFSKLAVIVDYLLRSITSLVLKSS